MLFTLYIVNKAGGLIYNKDLNPVPKQQGNEYLRLASTFHSLHAISKQLAPVKGGGIDVIDSPAFSLYCYESPTGIKFFVTARSRKDASNVPPTPAGVAPASSATEVRAFLRKVYEFYADFVLKNPFYELDMPIRLRLFDAAVEAHTKSTGLGTGQGMPAEVAKSSSTPMFTGSATSSGAPMFTGTSSG